MRGMLALLGVVFRHSSRRSQHAEARAMSAAVAFAMAASAFAWRVAISRFSLRNFARRDRYQVSTFLILREIDP
jgi:hypothetical protein